MEAYPSEAPVSHRDKEVTPVPENPKKVNHRVLSEVYEPTFVQGKKGTKGNTATFKVLPREYEKESINKGFEQLSDPGLYKPEFTAIENPIYREMSFKKDQIDRRSLYFEGIPEEALFASQPNFKHREAAKCSKTVGAGHCISSFKRLQHKLKRFHESIELRSARF